MYGQEYDEMQLDMALEHKKMEERAERNALIFRQIMTYSGWIVALVTYLMMR